MYCRWSSNYQEERVGFPFTGLPRNMLVFVLSQNQELQRHTLWSFFVFSELLWWEVIVRFVDICRIVGHHCLNFLFIIIDNHRHGVYHWKTLSHRKKTGSTPEFHMTSYTKNTIQHQNYCYHSSPVQFPVCAGLRFVAVLTYYIYDLPFHFCITCFLRKILQ